MRFIDVAAQIGKVCIQGNESIQLHAPLDTTQDGRALVLGEVMPGAGMYLP